MARLNHFDLGAALVGVVILNIGDVVRDRADHCLVDLCPFLDLS